MMKESNIVNELTDMYQKKLSDLVKRLNIRTKFAKTYKDKLYKIAEYAKTIENKYKEVCGAYELIVFFCTEYRNTGERTVDAIPRILKEYDELKETVDSREAKANSYRDMYANDSVNLGVELSEQKKKYRRIVALIKREIKVLGLFLNEEMPDIEKYQLESELKALKRVLAQHRANEAKLKKRNEKQATVKTTKPTKSG
jgi:hypothetical protein